MRTGFFCVDCQTKNDYFVYTTERLGDIWLRAKRPAAADAFQYWVRLQTVRPLAAGTYTFHPNGTNADQQICQGWVQSNFNRYTTTVTVSAPADAKAEALFDVASLSPGLGAAAPLKTYYATGFTGTIGKVSWDSNTLSVAVSSSSKFDGHWLDFIEDDGFVAVSVNTADATVSNKVLSWTVNTQPWKAGDKLMLRIHAGSVTQ